MTDSNFMTAEEAHLLVWETSIAISQYPSSQPEAKAPKRSMRADHFDSAVSYVTSTMLAEFARQQQCLNEGSAEDRAYLETEIRQRINEHEALLRRAMHPYVILN